VPYIVTTTWTGSHPSKSGTICTVQTGRTDVATLEEARNLANEQCVEYGDPFERECILLPESGGTVGPLPDGTVIEVTRL
jgi:hypothetical protein